MAIEDDAVPVPRQLVEQPALDRFGIGELHAYIGALQQEIARAQMAITQKSDHRGAAEAVFSR